jgi:hypothetical protein
MKSDIVVWRSRNRKHEFESLCIRYSKTIQLKYRVSVTIQMKLPAWSCFGAIPGESVTSGASYYNGGIHAFAQPLESRAIRAVVFTLMVHPGYTSVEMKMVDERANKAGNRKYDVHDANRNTCR